MGPGTKLWRTIKNSLLAVILVVILLLSAGIAIHYRDADFAVRVGSASAFSDMYAKLVTDYFAQSNSIPETESEVADFVLGEAANRWYKVINASSKQFLLGQRIDSTHIFEARYQISETGLVRHSSQVIDAK
jgi:type II secretory pathway pseudopilin PulG